MTVYVDELMAWGWRIRGHLTTSCHMIADTVEELDAAALAIGLKLRWRQPGRANRPPHYDLTPSRREKAVANGAVELNLHDFVDKMREIGGNQ